MLGFKVEDLNGIYQQQFSHLNIINIKEFEGSPFQ